MERKNIASGTPWEKIVGYSRAVRVGNMVEVSGTVAIDEKGMVVGETAYEQTVFILKKIQKALEQADSRLEDVVRTRIFVVDISTWEEVGKAHGEFFAQIRPVTTMVEVSRLIHPAMLLEIEATALVY